MATETTEYGYSYEYGIDVWIPGASEGAGEWQPFRFPTGIDVQTTPVTQPAATYDDLGAPNEVKLSESWTASFSVQQHRLADGSYLPEVEQLLVLAGPTANGNAASGLFRWYDKPATGEPNKDDAYEGDALVTLNRGETGNDGIGSWAVTLTGQGRRRQIENPWKGWGAD